jgi:hypothetical protein
LCTLKPIGEPISTAQPSQLKTRSGPAGTIKPRLDSALKLTERLRSKPAYNVTLLENTAQDGATRNGISA